MEKILVVNVNWAGDVIFSTPVFKALHQNYPEARISCLAVPRVRQILECCPYIDDIIVYDEKGKDRGFFAKWNLVQQLRKEKFSKVFLLHGSWTRALLVFLAGIPVRAGYATKGRGVFLTHRIAPASLKMHRADVYLKVVEAFGLQVVDRRCELTIAFDTRQQVDALLLEQGIMTDDPLVVVHVGGNWDLKRWPKENFALLIGRLINELKLKVVIPGTAADEPLAMEIAALSKSNPALLTGKTNLKQVIALMRRAELVISNDSGPLHMASAVGRKAVALFGPTRPEITGPRGSSEAVVLQKDVGCNRAPCYYLECPDNICMQALTVDDVFETVKKELTQR